MTSSEDHRGMGKDPRAAAHMQFSSPLAQHQSYMPYMHGYPYSQGFDPNHPGYRGMPSVMMQNYPGECRPEETPLQTLCQFFMSYSCRLPALFKGIKQPP